MGRTTTIAMLLGMLVGCNPSTTAVPAGGGPQVEIDTNMGKIKCELFEKESPGTVKNFLRYVDEKQYDGTIFHRVIDGFMIQGGGFEAQRGFDGGLIERHPTREPIRNEAGNSVENRRGTLAMARTDLPHSATSQFFINVKDNPGLDRAHEPRGVGYAVFGRVIDGMDVVDRIKTQQTATIGGHENVPLNAVIIESVRRIP
jgi:cyclophilin family peptidyl-prolyl cis-trans isomerase